MPTVRTTIPFRSRGFTILELLVVISIILVVIASILPAFGRLIESQNYTSAINSVTATLGSARALAISSGRRTGVVFLWDEERERMRLEVVQYNAPGSLHYWATRSSQYADAFVPAPNIVPVELPPRIGVFGLAPVSLRRPDLDPQAASISDLNNPLTSQWEWYGGDVIDGDDNDPANDRLLWIFPRNDPRIFTPRRDSRDLGIDPWARILGQPTDGSITDSEAQLALWNATTFFVQFDERGTAVAVARDGRDVSNAYLEFLNEPRDRSDPDSLPYDSPYTFDPWGNGPGVQQSAVAQDRRERNPEVMLRSADQFAVVDLGRMVDAVGSARAWLVRPESSRAPQPLWLADAGLFDDELAREVSRWIDLNAEIITFNRFSGNVIRRSPQ
ncbi:MAG: prepilin-type N-terminal cleavage/methylation domain-containing protein [Planctomycetota bacterium]|nr:prepilin-type N-terminal cleavage/methylation domain-containing protein [Planctomycetota bacterium]